MSKKEIPKIVADVLREVSEIIKEFNSKSDFKLVVKSSDDFLLKIYPKNHESIFFQINRYIIDDIYKPLDNATSTYFYSINGKSIKIMYPGNEEKPEIFVRHTRSQLTDLLHEYLKTVNKIYLTVDASKNATINLSDFFEIDEEEEELTPEPNTFETTDKILPYSLKQLQVRDFQGVKETGIDEIPVDTQWIFLVGENGFGKTTILQTIFLGLHGTLDGNINLLDDKRSSIQIEYKSLENNVINSLRDTKNPLIHLAAYGPGRLNLQGLNNENVEGNNNSLSYNLFKSDGFLFNINVVLKDSSLKKDSRFKLIKKAICTLIPNLADVKYNQETDQIEYIEREINNDGENITYQPLPFKKLASGFKSIIALAGDMIVRLSKNQPEVKDPSELKGIVLIDEIDLHLHPKLQKQLIGQFSKVFPKIQFIVSTHSPIPLLGAESNSVILKVNRTEAKGIQVEHVKIDLKNLTPNLVLTSGIFDMEDFISVQNENINEVRTEDSMTEMEENDKVAKYLEEFEKSDEHFPDELFLLKTSK
jgi:predicted ATPase